MKHLLRRNILLFRHLIQKACQILSTSTSECQCFHLHSQCLHFHAFTPILFTVIPQHINISPIHCNRYTALLKTLHCHFWWDTLPFPYDPHWLNTTFIFLGLYTYLNPLRFTVFSTDGVSVVKNLITCVLDFSSCLWSNQSEVHRTFYGF